MTKLPEILQADSVEVLDTEEEFGAKRFETWKSAVEADENRAVSGIVRDGSGRIFLVKYESGLNGWRLPGSSVDRIGDFEDRLRKALEEQLGVVPETVTPSLVQAHTAKHDGERATYYYVICETELGDSPESVLERDSIDEEVTFAWFDDRPEEVMNPTVISNFF